MFLSVIIEEFLALFRGFRVIHFLRNHSPISARGLQTGLEGFNLILCPGDGWGTG